jgi:hypothetical protein
VHLDHVTKLRLDLSWIPDFGCFVEWRLFIRHVRWRRSSFSQRTWYVVWLNVYFDGSLIWSSEVSINRCSIWKNLCKPTTLSTIARLIFKLVGWAIVGHWDSLIVKVCWNVVGVFLEFLLHSLGLRIESRTLRFLLGIVRGVHFHFLTIFWR